ncbi:MAG: hypothetical protein OXG10_00290 [Candidatus Dadabacteria bacterium]|nr:hypothetical protein [Candidatus Dadabacteria bacterium]
MEKLYNNPVWRRIRGLGGVGILALSVAFCLTGLLALSSCDDDDEEAEAEPMEMRGFFTSVDGDNKHVCSHEDVDVYLEGDESTGKLDVRIVSSGEEFGGAEFGHVGSKLIDSDGNKTIVTAYVTDDGHGNFVYPGSYYLTSKMDSAIADEETIFTGYWVGHLYRAPDHGVVICPYVLVPRTALEKDGCDGTTEAAMVPVGLQPYLTKNNGMELRACSNVFDDDGKVDPKPRM